MAKPIVLVGLPGAGKTTVGAALAKTLGRPFIDSDQEIEQRTGLTIAQIFETRGEAEFRALECKIVLELIAGDHGVIALGGGAWMDGELRVASCNRAFSVWLNAPLETIAARMADTSHRPLLREDVFASLQRLAAERSAVYAEADVRIASTTIEETIAAILCALKQS